MRIIALCLIVAVANASPYKVEKTYGSSYRQSQRSQNGGADNTFHPIGKSNYHIPFQVLQEMPDYKLLRFPASKWVCTTENIKYDDDPYVGWRDKFDGDGLAALVANKDYESPANAMFTRLYKYIVAVNNNRSEIQMSMPIVDHRVPIEGGEVIKHELCFWTGIEWVDKKLPEPENDLIYIKNKEYFDVFVRKFGGYSLSNNDWKSQMELLKEATADRDDVITDSYYTVGYDAPTVRKNRRNEIWLAKKNGANDESTSDDNMISMSYLVLETYTNFELRQYPRQKWACTKTDDIDPTTDSFQNWEEEYDSPYDAMSSSKWKKTPFSKMYEILYLYANGVNDGNKKIGLTRPLTVLHVAESGSDFKESQEMCFWLPPMYQKTPPPPVALDVVIKDKDMFQVYAKTFDGFMLSHRDFMQKYKLLVKELGMADLSDFDKNVWGHAVYNSPFTSINRKNEVWIEKIPS